MMKMVSVVKGRQKRGALRINAAVLERWDTVAK
jgi:hypothetical protein